MTTEQLVKRADKSQTLKCMLLKDGTFLVESSDGKIMYPVSANGTASCTCADFQRNRKTDSAFRCKHILAALECTTSEETVEPAERKKPKLDERFIKNLQGKDFVLYNGLIDLAHQKGLVKLEVDVIQYPTTENGNEAVCRAVAETKHGDRFTDIGDASPKNTNKMIASHIIRMASTRAKARALRDLTNVGLTAIEELGDLDDVIGADNSKAIKSIKPAKKEIAPEAKPVEKEAQKTAPAKEVKAPETKKEVAELPKPKATAVPKQETASKPTDFAQKLSEAQKRAMYNVSRRRGITQDELEGMVKNTFNVPVDDLTQAQASQFIRQLQTAA